VSPVIPPESLLDFPPLLRGELEDCPAARGFATSSERDRRRPPGREHTLEMESNQAYNILAIYIEIIVTDVLLLSISIK
jgi:hypothetical protein